MSRVSSDLQNIVLKLRMVPVDTVFNRFPRMVRDLAKTLDKKIDLIITGAETELDHILNSHDRGRIGQPNPGSSDIHCCRAYCYKSLIGWKSGR